MLSCAPRTFWSVKYVVALGRGLGEGLRRGNCTDPDLLREMSPLREADSSLAIGIKIFFDVLDPHPRPFSQGEKGETSQILHTGSPNGARFG